MEILYHLFRFGFYNTYKEINDIIYPLIQLLDGRSDEIGSISKKLKNNNNNNDNITTNSLRFIKNDKTMIVMEVKYTICLILNSICDYRLDKRLTELLTIFKKKVKLKSTQY